ncbi:MAG TPA: carboxypeptidase-like regulatory domain-containing protein [Vicinamibacterales bacterium]|nr:carboxypeptidase-like regulatory domain-containing protein [Vicinamibacterales bacterium]
MRLRTIGVAIGLAALLVASLLAQSPPPGKLNGTVVDTSDAVMPGVSIALRGPESRSTVSDRNGAFAFAALPLGGYELRASLDGFATVVRTAIVADSIEPLRIRMRVGRSAGEIAGMVRDVSGALLAGVSVEIASPNLVEKVRVTTTGSDGRYRFLDLPDGTYSVTFLLPGFWMARRDGVTLRNGSSATVDATMRVGGHHSDVIAAVTVTTRRP